MIIVKNVVKTYKTFYRDSGLKNAIKSLFQRKYDLTCAVDQVNFQIQEGEFIAFLGPNGAGKTTLLKMLCGILPPTKGEIDIKGFNPFNRDKAFLKKISYVSAQKNQLWWDIPAADSLKINQAIYEIDEKKFKESLQELTSLFRVENLLTKPVRSLSLGQRMKLEIIAALIHKPTVLLLDEPTIGLDFISREEIRHFLKSYQRKNNTTIILTSHYLEDIQNLCDRILLINKGKLLLDDSLSILLSQYEDQKVMKVSLGENSDFLKKLSEYEINRNDETIEYLVSKKTLSGLIEAFPDSTFEVGAVNLEAILKTFYTR